MNRWKRHDGRSIGMIVDGMNELLKNHPSMVEDLLKLPTPVHGMPNMLWFMNNTIGADELGNGPFVAVYNTEGKIVRFEITKYE